MEERRLAEVEAELFRRGAPVQVELSSLADPSIAPQLTRCGYALVGFENVLGHALSSQPERVRRRDADIEVEILGHAGFEGWLISETDVTQKSTPLESVTICRNYLKSLGI